MSQAAQTISLRRAGPPGRALRAGRWGLVRAAAVLLAGVLSAWPTLAATLLAPTHVQVANNDQELAGDSVRVTWQPPPAGVEPRPALYRVYLGEDREKLEVVDVAEGADRRELAVRDLAVGHRYYARVGAVYLPPGEQIRYDPEDPNRVVTPGAQEVLSEIAGPAQTVGRWYKPQLTNVLVITLLLSVITLVVLYVARRREMYVRPIAGLQAVEDAIGRATEMGRPILYVSGLGGAGDIATIASMLILGHLAHKTAPYATRIIVPVSDPMVMTTEREIVSQAYLHAGHPEQFNAEDIFFVTDSQFGYVSAVAGMMLREKPAVNFFMGYFAAESLMLAETGNVIDTLQIAGTDQDNQLPFFVTACDYTLIGEELYAAGAYLSRHPVLLAQLKAQDIGKALLAALVVGGVLFTVAIVHLMPEWSSLVQRFLALLKV